MPDGPRSRRRDVDFDRVVEPAAHGAPDRRMRVAPLGERSGYESEAAFNRAFKQRAAAL